MVEDATDEEQPGNGDTEGGSQPPVIRANAADTRWPTDSMFWALPIESRSFVVLIVTILILICAIVIAYISPGYTIIKVHKNSSNAAKVLTIVPSLLCSVVSYSSIPIQTARTGAELYVKLINALFRLSLNTPNWLPHVVRVAIVCCVFTFSTWFLFYIGIGIGKCCLTTSNPNQEDNTRFVDGDGNARLISNPESNPESDPESEP